MQLFDVDSTIRPTRGVPEENIIFAGAIELTLKVLMKWGTQTLVRNGDTDQREKKSLEYHMDIYAW
jgi:hypothetical protein